MAKYRIIQSDEPLTEGKIPPIVEKANKEAERLGGKVLDIHLSSAMIKYDTGID